MKLLRPKHHITAEKNWINDPNGVVKYKNQYHVFFQHHPYSLEWGEMNWGHVVSDDLLNWQHLPIALTPGAECDKDHCFSGSSLVVDDRLYIFYTGLLLADKPEDIKQQQCLAYSDDGIKFHKLGLIIGEDLLPKEYNPSEFRDPTVYVDNGIYYLLVAAKRKEGNGNILKYKSLDLIHWEYVNEILINDSKGEMVECPDYIKELNLLLHSEQFQPIDGLMHHNIHSTFYDIGHFNEQHKFISCASGTIDYGFDMYAPQVIKGDNILIGWMNMWDRNNPSEKYGFSGSLTIPRKLIVENNTLRQIPIVPTNKVVVYDVKHYEEHVRVGFYKLDIDNLESLSIKMRQGPEHVTTFDLSGDEWIFNRSKSGETIKGVETDNDSLNGIRRMPFEKSEHYEIYLILDEFSVELFVNGISLTSLIYPNLDDDLLVIDVASTKIKITKFE